MPLRGYQTAAPTDSKYRLLVTTCGACLLAMPADWVRGILTREEAGSEDPIISAGVTYTRTDLPKRLGLPPLSLSSDTRVILYGHQTCLCAFTVDKVFELVEASRHQIRPLPVQFRNAERNRLAGFFLYRETLALIVNPFWLLEMGPQTDAFQYVTGSARQREQSSAQPSGLLSAAEHVR